MPAPPFPQLTTTLPNGVVATVEAAPHDIDLAHWHRNHAVIITDNTVITLRLRRRDQLALTAQHAGAWLAATPVPMTPLLALALSTLTGELPEPWHLSILRFVGATLPPLNVPDHEPAALRAIRALVYEALHRETDDPGLDLGGDRWVVARMLGCYGEALWALRGADARRWGSLPLGVPTDPPLLRILVGMAGVMHRTAQRAGHVTLPLADGGHPTDAIIDWLALVAGPAPPPAALLPGGLGRVSTHTLVVGSATEPLTLDPQRAEALRDLAAILLARVSRPAPRYLGEVLDLTIPPGLMAEVTAWNIARVRVIPHPEGLWVAVGGADDEAAAVAWWGATPASSTRFPISFPPAAWLLMHAILAALWHDLCAEAIVMEPQPDAAPPARPSGAREATGRGPGGGRSVRLPPVRYLAHWGSDEDRALINAYVLAGHGYRRLPSGWEARQDRRDFQRRTTAAADRAHAHGLDAPPPGYTYVAPHQRPAGRIQADEGLAAPRQVQARGLFTLRLGLRRNDDEAPLRA
ncbi:hypothetical protein [Candidatus Chloroploca asiatica]|uniref:Uncharacterized protein n=1 Tax=Candidatus Chloroploca asiatica TaxID=1506545 RepID=A0A2H3KIS9_9CHLR|nr:hypothetical protein [Candidatus Chloroploca asiatica]PDV97773.1 hypothetical protein A9Q02_17680 [Candidatus Chloroploca asiatica]